MKTNFLIISAAIILSAVSGVLGQTQSISNDELILEKPVAPHAKIDDVYRRFSEAYRKLDPEAVTNLYTDDALYLSPGSEVTRGREKIRPGFESFFRSVKDGGGSLSIAFRILERRVSGDLAYDVGIYTLTQKNKIGEQRASSGKFLVVAVRAPTGEWRFQVDIYNELPKALPKNPAND